MLRGKVKKRISLIFLCTIMIFCCILGKLGYEQIFHHEDIMEKALSLWEREFTIAGLRGSILDKNGNVLAHDIPSTSVMVVPAQIKDPDATAEKLSEILGADKAKIKATISKHVSTQKIQPEGRLISDDKAKKLEAMDLDGVYLVQDSLRNYPNNNYLAQVLGFTGIDNQGLAGLELQYNDILTAKSGALHIPFDAKGHNVDLYQENYEAPGRGMNVKLTIDSNIQDVLEREINNLVKKYSPKSALALAMDPNTGEVLAMVSKPDFDPNHYQDYSSDVYNRNLPIWMSYEPGSTFKSVIFSSALELNLFDMYKDTYMDKGYEMVGGARIKSWKAGGHGLQTFLQVLENSSNPGFVEISRRMGLDNEYAYVKKFGFGEKTGIDLPGESSGIMFKKEAMGEVEQATVAFGQGLSVTPIQLVTAFSAIVNGGTLYKPYITKSVNDPITNEVIMEQKPTVNRRVISEDTSKKMRYALESVVANGGGKPAYMEGYKIGGKTGTAQKAENGVYSSTNYVLSFLSAAPIDNPKIVLYIAADSPKNDVLYGGTVIAPIAKACYEDILPYLGVKKTKDQIPKKLIWPETENIKVQDFVGKKKKDVTQEGVTFTFIGEGDTVMEQMPEAGTTLGEQGEVWIYLGNDKIK
ncbi:MULTISPECIES: penicillin-binding transpeptidase domain-containing protein [Bacillota]|uniref:Stage V sporulation protein D n=1 Tax=Amedibacillus hominis TaxID=2897776 RepID=A0ABS9R591_9FIRM|nr:MULTISPECIES: penicillin-binding transpeptidase domain-containing protein [Bacillota]MCH4284823.1 stage V sporulation protein D [Amedibacillus hominis]RGB55047.1 stage V sporulation protein D [Absiella sp. AM22-9]RGB62637.1 stage V sporulation protein D [Absiella sp. AM10-20]RGB69547.1 stage V sporulation protein D [Absiella sp. AM09-45]RGB77685.1 stage V sporulation protein D [Absiella sp. AM09-50]